MQRRAELPAQPLQNLSSTGIDELTQMSSHASSKRFDPRSFDSAYTTPQKTATLLLERPGLVVDILICGCQQCHSVALLTECFQIKHLGDARTGKRGPYCG